MPTQDELLLKLIAQDEASKALDEARERLDKMTDAEKEMLKVSKEAEKVTKKQAMGLADLKAGLDIVANVGGKVVDFLKEAVNDTVKYAESVRDLSRAIGTSAEESSAMIQVADDVMVSVGTLEAAFKAAIKNGIQPSIDTLAKLSDEYKAIQDPVQRSQFAMDKFGRAGLDMAKMLEMGGDAIRDAAGEARQLGLTLSEEDVKAAREFEIQLDNMGDKAEALKISLAKGLIPKLNEFFDTMQRGIEVGGQLANGVGTLDQVENNLSAVVARNVVMFGEYNIVTLNSIQALKDYLLIRQQVGMTEQEAGLRSNMAASAAAQAARATQENAVMVRDASAATKEHSNELLYNVQQYQLQQAAAAEAAKAEAVHRTSIAESITANANLAQSLKDATTAQAIQSLATSQLDTLKKAYEEGTISQQGYEKATDAIMLRYGLATPVSLAMADAQEAINAAFLSGQLPLNDYITSTDKIPAIAKDGKVTMQELATLGIKPTTQAVIEETGRVDLMAIAWKGVPREVTTVYKIKVEGEIPPGASPEARAYGGPVTAGMPYLVGERGPEMFIPNGNGRIVSNSVTTNSTQYNITTDKTGLAYLFERQRMAEARM